MRVTIARRARELGFSTTVGIIHDGHGSCVTLDERQRRSSSRSSRSGSRRSTTPTTTGSRRTSRTGSRTTGIAAPAPLSLRLRGRPGPLVLAAARSSRHSARALRPDDLRREYHQDKSCAPFCTVGCVHRVAQVDELRDDPASGARQWFAPPVEGQRPHLPPAVRILQWAFVTGPGRELFRKAAARVSGGPHRG